MEVTAAVYKSEFVVISGWQEDNGTIHRDIFWDQQSLLFKLLAATSTDDFEAEVHTILQDLPEVPSVHMQSSGLGEVLRIMSINRCDDVGLVNGHGLVQSMVRFSHIFKAFVKEISNIYFHPQIITPPNR